MLCPYIRNLKESPLQYIQFQHISFGQLFLKKLDNVGMAGEVDYLVGICYPGNGLAGGCRSWGVEIHQDVVHHDRNRLAVGFSFLDQTEA